MDYTFEPLSKYNFKHLKYLFKVILKKNLPLDFIKKKYDTTYLGTSYFGNFALMDNHPVAFAGAIPVNMKYKDHIEIAAQFVDAITLSNHRGKGLFTKLIELTEKQLIAAGIKFAWGLPNKKSENIFVNKLNWQIIEHLEGFKINTSKIAIDKLARKNIVLNKLYEKRVRKVLSKYSSSTIFRGSIPINEEFVFVDRNNPYYLYKSYSINFAIELERTLFWISLKNGFFIGDVESPSNEVFIKSLKKLKDIASKIGVGEIIFQASPNTLISKLLKDKADEQFESWGVIFKNFSSNFPLKQLKFTFGDIDIY